MRFLPSTVSTGWSSLHQFNSSETEGVFQAIWGKGWKVKSAVRLISSSELDRFGKTQIVFLAAQVYIVRFFLKSQSRVDLLLSLKNPLSGLGRFCMFPKPVGFFGVFSTLPTNPGEFLRLGRAFSFGCQDGNGVVWGVQPSGDGFLVGPVAGGPVGRGRRFNSEKLPLKVFNSEFSPEVWGPKPKRKGSTLPTITFVRGEPVIFSGSSRYTWTENSHFSLHGGWEDDFPFPKGGIC